MTPEVFDSTQWTRLTPQQQAEQINKLRVELDGLYKRYDTAILGSRPWVTAIRFKAYEAAKNYYDELVRIKKY